MRKTMKTSKPKLIGFNIEMEVDSKIFKFQIGKDKKTLKDLLEKNSLKGIKVSYCEILQTFHED